MPKPKGTLGATKMKIMAIISYNCDSGKSSYGYNIWQCLKNYFHHYINDSDVRNVYSHLKELCELGYITKMEYSERETNKKCYYQITERGRELKHRYDPYLNVVQLGTVDIKKY